MGFMDKYIVTYDYEFKGEPFQIIVNYPNGQVDLYAYNEETAIDVVIAVIEIHKNVKITNMVAKKIS
jgi:hypothetical protein